MLTQKLEIRILYTLKIPPTWGIWGIWAAVFVFWRMPVISKEMCCVAYLVFDPEDGVNVVLQN
jgi:hypothetical protein